MTPTTHDSAHLRAARSGDEAAFARLVEPCRRGRIRRAQLVAFVAVPDRHPRRDTGVAATAASVNSAVQRARRTLESRVEPLTQQATLRALGDDGQRDLVGALVAAWERGDVDGIVSLLAADARFTMPPLPAWFDGRVAVGRFFAERVFQRPWRLAPLTANGQLAVACYMGDDDGLLPLSGVTVLTLKGARSWPSTASSTPPPASRSASRCSPTDEFTLLRVSLLVTMHEGAPTCIREPKVKPSAHGLRWP